MSTAHSFQGFLEFIQVYVAGAVDETVEELFPGQVFEFLCIEQKVKHSQKFPPLKDFLGALATKLYQLLMHQYPSRTLESETAAAH